MHSCILRSAALTPPQMPGSMVDVPISVEDGKSAALAVLVQRFSLGF
jgi:hypothetical protein